MKLEMTTMLEIRHCSVLSSFYMGHSTKSALQPAAGRKKRFVLLFLKQVSSAQETVFSVTKHTVESRKKGRTYHGWNQVRDVPVGFLLLPRLACWVVILCSTTCQVSDLAQWYLLERVKKHHL